MSRNQREGKFIPGWCHNPAYKKGSNPLKPETMKVKLRAGAHYDIFFIRDKGLGKMYVRFIREGAFE